MLSDIGHIKAGLFRTWILPVDKDPMAQMIAERKAYDDRVKGKSGKHNFGAPDHAIWRGMVDGTLRLVQTVYAEKQSELDNNQQLKADYTELSNYSKAMKPSTVIYEVKYCRYVKTFKSTTKKLNVVTRHTGDAAMNCIARIWRTVLDITETTGVDVKGGLERKNEELAGW